MKKLNRIKLTTLDSNEIADREQRLLKGGSDKLCGCIGVCVEEMCGCIEDDGQLVLNSNNYSTTDILDEVNASIDGVNTKNFG